MIFEGFDGGRKGPPPPFLVETVHGTLAYPGDFQPPVRGLRFAVVTVNGNPSGPCLGSVATYGGPEVFLDAAGLREFARVALFLAKELETRARRKGGRRR